MGEEEGHRETLTEALASILHKGLCALRGLAGRDQRYVRAEAHHLHNLPRVLLRPRAEIIRYYIETEVPRYLDALGRIGGEVKSLAPDYGRHWAVIEDCLREQAGTPCGGGITGTRCPRT
jgi:hypothetical protein